MRVVHLSTIHRALDIRIFMKECCTLAQYGYDVHLVIQDPPDSMKNGVIFHDLCVSVGWGRWRRFFVRTVNVWKLAWGLRGDVYHFHDPELIVLGLWLKLRGARVIYDVHEDAPREAIALNRAKPWFGYFKALVWCWLEKISIYCLDGFVCVTPEIAARFPAARTVLVRNFPLLMELKADGVEDGGYCDRTPTLVYAGGLTPIRGIAEIIAATGMLPNSLNAKLILMGEFSSPEWKQTLEQQPGWQRTNYLGWQARKTVLQQYKQSRIGLVVLQPEQIYVESIPNKLFEYMAAGLPVVASNFPRWQQLIADLDCGMVVNPQDPQDIAAAMQYLLENPQVAAAMGQRGQKAVQATYNWEHEATHLLSLYNRLDDTSPQE